MKLIQSAALALMLVTVAKGAMPQSADGNGFSAKLVAQQRLLDYTRTQDELLRTLRQTNGAGWQVEADRIIELRTMEYQVQWFFQNGLLDQPPALVLVGVPLRHKQQLPGRILEVRLQAAKLAIWDPQLCSKNFSYAEPPSRLATGFGATTAVSTNYPVDDDFLVANGYARYLVQRREFADAAKHFETAALKVPFGGTITKEWEYENLVSAAWAHLMAGNFEKSYNRLLAAQALPLQAEVSGRARYLMHFYRLPNAPALAGDWDAALPK